MRRTTTDARETGFRPPLPIRCGIHYEPRSSWTVHRSLRPLLISTMASLAVLCPGSAQEVPETNFDFDWQQYRTSPVDLLVDDAEVFRHSKSGLDADEQRAWQKLINEVGFRRRAVQTQYPENDAAHWEMAFYRFTDVRRMAWESGSLQIRRPEQKKDPFRPAFPVDPEPSPVRPGDQEYSLFHDIQNHPTDFVGKPVVLRGILQRPQPEKPDPSGPRPPSESTRLSVGKLFPFDGGNAPIAHVHTTSVDRTDGEHPGLGAWPATKKHLPVLVKGWVVKLWSDQRPLIYCESVRELGVQPPTALIQQHAVSKQPLVDKESWLYYETLSALTTVHTFRTTEGKRFWDMYPQRGSPESPQQAAHRFLRLRLDNLRKEIAVKARADKARLDSRLETKKISDERHTSELKRLQYLLETRMKRYDAARVDSRQFETYVDLFLNPDVWQGQLVTLHGHVRHVVSFPATHPQFRGQDLHELWLFTDDSQNNPTVIITPTLPQEFPVNADLINQVSVTGCVFKQYVYRSQESRRIAPLILAGNIQWSPSDSHIRALQELGHLASGSPLTQRLSPQRTQESSGIILLLGCFTAILSIMVLWGRAQRNRSQRRNLMNRISEKPEFGMLLDSESGPRLSEYTSGYDL